MKNVKYASLHNHSDFSNLRFLDSVIKVDEMIDTAFSLGYSAVAFTDHEALSVSVKATNYLQANKEKFKDFKVILGNESYLVSEKEMKQAEENKEKFKFNHCLFLVKNKHGHGFLRKQSTLAWKHRHMYRGQERVPSFYNEIEELMKDYKGDVIFSTACISGYFAQNALKFHETRDKKYFDNIVKFFEWAVKVFGEGNVCIEAMPSHSEEQDIINEAAWYFANKLGLRYIVTLDAHYINNEQRPAHSALLRSRQADRPLEGYDTARLMSKEELSKYFDKERFDVALKNINDIVEQCENYTFNHTPIIPNSHIPEFTPLLQSGLVIDEQKYDGIAHYLHSNSIEDQYYVKLIFDGMKEHNCYNEKYLERVNLELNELWAISQNLNQPMSSYFLAAKEFVDIMWESGSIVGYGRGSAGCWVTNYLLDIVQVDAVRFNFPYYRFLSKERVQENIASNYPDVDIDTEANKRQDIVDNVKKRFGEDKVLNFCTFSTLASRNSILYACRGLGLDKDLGSYLISLIPRDSDGKELDIEEALLGNEKKGIKPNKKLNAEFDKYKNLKETVLELKGLVIGRSEHASALAVFNTPYVEYNASMTTKDGIVVTQFDAEDSELMSAIKFDFLTISSLDIIHEAYDLLVQDNLIQEQGDFRTTFNKYFSVDNLDDSNQDMYDKLFNGEIIEAFQFSAPQGEKGLKQVNARNVNDLVSASALIRLRSDSTEQPLQKYVRFRDNHQEWVDEMTKNGLTSEEQNILHELLDDYNGICLSQEKLMLLSMKVAGFSLNEANKIRKAIAKKNAKLQEIQHQHFMEKGLALGRRKEFLNYVWKYCVEIQKGYAFSDVHGLSYVYILICEMNICRFYGSIYWQTACLNVSSGLSGDVQKQVDYGKIAKAISNLPKGLIVPPDVNNSDWKFTISKNHILFSLYAISGVSSKEIQAIIDGRPYGSFKEFVEVNKDTISQKKIVQLIKSGIFRTFCKDTRENMIAFVKYAIPKKNRLTTVVLNKISDFVPEQYKNQVKLYQIKKALKNGLKVDTILGQFFINNVQLDYNLEDEKIVVNQKEFNKWFNKEITPLKEWLKTEEALDIEVRIRRNEFWKENCSNAVEQWYFETLNFYPFGHFLSRTNLNEFFDYKSFNELPTVPQVKALVGRNKYPIYQTYEIAGTIVNKNNVKKTVDLLTPDGLAICKMGDSLFSKYNKVIKNGNIKDSSWFERGTNLILLGTRNGNEFRVKRVKNATSVLKIVNNGYKIKLQKRN